MTLSDRTGASEYERLRAEYDRAFARLRTAAQHGSADQADEQAAMDLYRECREKLARYLASGSAATAPKREVATLAYRLWEEAGRPIGRPQEHWYKAERIIRQPHTS